MPDYLEHLERIDIIAYSDLLTLQIPKFLFDWYKVMTADPNHWKLWEHSDLNILVTFLTHTQRHNKGQLGEGERVKGIFIRFP